MADDSNYEQLKAASTLTGAEIVPLKQSGWQVQALLSSIKDYVLGTLSPTELGYIDGVTAGTAAASKAVVLDANKDIATIRNLTATSVAAGNLSGTFAGGATLNQTAFTIQDITTTGTAILGTTSVVALDKSDGVLASTLAAPSTGRYLIITQYDSGTSGHTVTLGSGTFDGTNTIATFNAKGDTLVLLGLTAASFLVLQNTGVVLSA